VDTILFVEKILCSGLENQEQTWARHPVTLMKLYSVTIQKVYIVLTLTMVHVLSRRHRG